MANEKANYQKRKEGKGRQEEVRQELRKEGNTGSLKLLLSFSQLIYSKTEKAKKEIFIKDFFHAAALGSDRWLVYSSLF